MNKDDNIMVSVLMLSYNHERTIARAIESVISQKTGYKYELIVGDDQSTDNSATIIREYAEKYPDKIVAICRQDNIGTMRNIKDLVIRSQGKYIAICEGDDYWVDDRKIEKQVCFLDRYSDYSACYTKCRVMIDGDEGVYPFSECDSLSMEDMLNDGNVKRYATCTFVCRNLYKDHPDLLDFFQDGKVGDIIFQTVAMKNGKIKYLEEVTAVYDKTISSGHSFSALIIEKQVNDIRKAISVCKEISGKGYYKSWNKYMARFDVEVYWDKKKDNSLSAIKWLWKINSDERREVIKRLIDNYIDAKKK